MKSRRQRVADDKGLPVPKPIPKRMPVRQWVLSVPKPVRRLLTYDAALMAQVVGIFTRAVRAHLARVAKRELGLGSVREAHTGVVSAIQRFGSAAEVNPHVHSLVPDGVFIEHGGGTVRFHALPAPTSVEVHA